MNLAVVNEAVTGMNGVEHEFTEEEKNFVVQFAFRSGSKEDTISLIEALAHSTDKVQSEEIMVTYRSKYDIKPAWVEQVENLLVALEMYRIEEEKAISHLSDILTACIIFIRGFDPIMDNKYIPFRHPMFNQTADGKGKAYVHNTQGADRIIGPPFEILSEKAVKHYEKMKDKGENVYIDTLTYEQFMMLGDAELNRRFSMQDEAEQKAKIDREQANELEYADESQKEKDSDNSGGGQPVRNPEREKPKWEDTITNRMMHWSYTAEQKEEVKKALAAGVPKATILTYFYPEVTVEKMSSYRKNQ